MVEDYHQRRSRELGMPEGTGKRYNREELIEFYAAAEIQYREAVSAENKVRSYLDGHVDYNLHRGTFDPEALTKLWSEAVGQLVVYTPERLFYLGTDILRIRHGKDWIFKGTHADLTATDRFQRQDKLVYDKNMGQWEEKDLPPSTYTLHFYSPAFVSPSDYLSVTAKGEALPDEEIELVRTPISHEWSEERGFYNQQFAFSLGNPITTHYLSRFYSEKPQAHIPHDFDMQMHSLHRLQLTPQQIQTFASRLWRAHQHTPSDANNKN